MKGLYKILVAIWIIANIVVFLLPSFIQPLKITSINMDVVNSWVGIIDPMIALVLGIIGLIAYMGGTKKE